MLNLLQHTVQHNVCARSAHTSTDQRKRKENLNVKYKRRVNVGSLLAVRLRKTASFPQANMPYMNVVM